MKRILKPLAVAVRSRMARVPLGNHTGTSTAFWS